MGWDPYEDTRSRQAQDREVAIDQLASGNVRIEVSHPTRAQRIRGATWACHKFGFVAGYDRCTSKFCADCNPGVTA